MCGVVVFINTDSYQHANATKLWKILCLISFTMFQKHLKAPSGIKIVHSDHTIVSQNLPLRSVSRDSGLLCLNIVPCIGKTASNYTAQE